jgi:hypothetical protein
MALQPDVVYQFIQSCRSGHGFSSGGQPESFTTQKRQKKAQMRRKIWAEFWAQTYKLVYIFSDMTMYKMAEIADSTNCR